MSIQFHSSQTKDLVSLDLSTGLLLLVIAVSLDGFTVGISYGLKHVKIPFIALFIIMMCSGMVVMTSMSIGHMLQFFITETMTNLLGGIIFIMLGLFVLFSLRQTSTKNEKKLPRKKLKNKSTGLKTVLKSPDNADLDQSGTSSLWEATLLGIALALDAFGAGLGASEEHT